MWERRKEGRKPRKKRRKEGWKKRKNVKRKEISK